MKRYLPLFVGAAITAAFPVSAQEAKTYPAPSEIVAAAKADEWVDIAPADLLVMDLAPDSTGRPRRVVIQLIPAPFSQGWVSNIRKLAAAKWWDGTSINRVQDNYVVQWGDATEKKALPDGLAVVPETDYVAARGYELGRAEFQFQLDVSGLRGKKMEKLPPAMTGLTDAYAQSNGMWKGWPFASDNNNLAWPIHCYAMVGVGRNISPDTGTGAELYTVIGHAPRHLDRNIALVGRVIEGIEQLSSLPRGTGALGFYEKKEERVPLLSVRLGNQTQGLATFEYLSTDSNSFAAYADARANRRDAFFNVPAGGADICNIPVPIRRKAN